MEGKVKFMGHPVHPFLVTLPIGLLAGSVIFDFAGLYSHSTEWGVISFRLIQAGLITGLIAAIFGALDWASIPWNTRAKKIGAIHAFANVMALVIFLFSAMLRNLSPDAPSLSAYFLSLAGLLVLLVGGWLGGELVNRLGIGVDDKAHVNAGSSLAAPAKS